MLGNYLAKKLLNCGDCDLQILDRFTDSGIFCEALKNLRVNGTKIDLESVFRECVRIAMTEVFGLEVDYAVNFNYGATYVKICNADGIDNFDSKQTEFDRLSGFYLYASGEE